MDDRVRTDEESNSNTEVRRRGRPPGKHLEKSTLKVAETNNKMMPFMDKESLPDFVVDKKGKLVKGGDKRYYLQGLLTGGYKLMAVYRKNNGIAKRMICTLKTNQRNKMKDIAYFKELTSQGIPINPEI